MKKKLALYKTKVYSGCHDRFFAHKALISQFLLISKTQPSAGFLRFIACKNPLTNITHTMNEMTNMTSPQDLTEAISQLQGSMVHLVEKQSVLMDKLDGFVMKVMAHEERLKRLEDSLLTHLECATWVKATIRFWPVLVAGILLLLGHQVH